MYNTHGLDISYLEACNFLIATVSIPANSLVHSLLLLWAPANSLTHCLLLLWAPVNSLVHS